MKEMYMKHILMILFFSWLQLIVNVSFTIDRSCLTDSQCKRDEYCSTKRKCIPSCTSSNECPKGMFCKKGFGRRNKCFLGCKTSKDCSERVEGIDAPYTRYGICRNGECLQCQNKQQCIKLCKDIHTGRSTKWADCMGDYDGLYESRHCVC